MLLQRHASTSLAKRPAALQPAAWGRLIRLVVESRVALFYDPACQNHRTGEHVENGDRMTAIREAIARNGLAAHLCQPVVEPADVAEVESVHDPAYVERIRTIADRGGGMLTADTVISPGSYRAALAAAGCTVQAVDAVMAGHHRSAFALVRPPGHHASSRRGMGFCLFNNIAIAARHAIVSHSLERVLIVDFDAHHGNGTQELFYDSSQVMYFSSHLYPYYFPGTGALHEIGRGPGTGYTANVPVPAETGDAGFRRIYEEVLVALARRYSPQLVLVSAGYDVHWADPITDLGASITGISHIVAIIKAIADDLCLGRLVLTLEGGYDLTALAGAATATLQVLLGLPVVDPLGPPYHGRDIDVSDVVARVKQVHSL
jgi:acetoin utilization deacetylase AcuC-like enzyme